MPGPKLLVYTPQNFRCDFYYAIFNSAYTIEQVSSKKHFFQKLITFNPDITILCLCSPSRVNAEEVAELQALMGPLPSLVCSKTLPLDFVSAAGQLGINGFLSCQWDKFKIEDTVLESISRNGIKKYIEKSLRVSLTYSPHISKIILLIIHSFPKRLNEIQIAGKLGISVSWLQKLFRRAFKLSYHHFLRRIWILQALCLMKYTNMDNTEIALYLHYTEESSMARDFRKELGHNPTKARQQLIKLQPNQLL